MRSVSARDANQAFSRLLSRAADGEEIIITSRGKPVVKLGPVADGAVERTRARAAARMIRRMRKGAHLGQLRASRDEMHER